MTIEGKCHEGWPLAPYYQSEPVPLVRSPKIKDLSKLFEDKKPPRTK